MSGISINVIVKEFLELVPIINGELTKLYKHLRDIELNQTNLDKAIKQLDKDWHYRRYYDPEVGIIRKRI
jgi:hypothetical protein